MEENKETSNDEQSFPENETQEVERFSLNSESEKQIPRPLFDLTLSTPNLKPTNEMEVHHHGHVHESKKWKEYIFQFLMLFLAITLGFFVENRREHYIEDSRAKVFAKLLIEDLEVDVVEFNRSARVLNKIIVAGDSLGRLLGEKDIRAVPGGKLYYYEYWSGWRWSILSRDATLQQLKNSGALRYLGDASLIRKILNYDESIRLTYMLQNKYEPEKTVNWNLVQKVFDQAYFNKLDSIKVASRDSTAKPFSPQDQDLLNFLNSNYPLLSYEKNVLDELKNWAYNSSRNYRVLVKDIHSAKQKALDGIEALKKEHDLK
jgi:hypothetical protein